MPPPMTGSTIALKVFHDGDHEDTRFERELYYMINKDRIAGDIVDNAFPFLPALGVDVRPMSYALGLPLVPGTLRGQLAKDGAFDELTGKSVGIQLAFGLEYLHTKRGVIHLDLKCQNILWNPFDGRAYIIDFGMAEKVEERRARRATYTTANYRPPELWAPRPGWQALRPAADIWSFGAIMYEVFAGVMLIPGSSERHVYACLQLLGKADAKQRARRFSVVPQPLQKAVAEMCAAQASSRPRASTLIETFSRRVA